MNRFFTMIVAFMFVVLTVLTFQNSNAMQNPWVDCEADFECANKVSGITFPLRLSNYWIRAMKGMIEIGYPLDEFRSVEVRKAGKEFGYDISGVYKKYPVNKKMKLSNGVVLDTKGTLTKTYVVNLTGETGYYSAYCEQGMTKDEVQGVYEVIQDAEVQKIPVTDAKNKYSSCEIGDLVGEDVKRIKYLNYNIDYHKNDFTKKQVIKLADECIKEGVKSQYEMDCCMTSKMFK